MYPYPIKDWRDDSRYENSSYMSASEWAWEFLRRNGQYQESFDKYSPLAVGKMNQAFYVLDRDYDVDVIPIFKIAKKYGLAGDRVCSFPNPRYSTSCLFWSKLEGSEYSSLLNVLPTGKLPRIRHPSFDNGQPIVPKNEYDLVVRLDMRMTLADIQKQVSDLHSVFSKEGGFVPPKIRKQSRLYPSYVRVLDAFADGADKKEVARVLFPQVENNYGDSFAADKTISNWKKEAERLRDGGFAALFGVPK